MARKKPSLPPNVPTLTDVVTPGNTPASPRPAKHDIALDDDVLMWPRLDDDKPAPDVRSTQEPPPEPPATEPPAQEDTQPAATFTANVAPADEIDIDVDALLATIKGRLPVLVGGVLQRHLSMAKEEIVEQVLDELRRRLLDD